MSNQEIAEAEARLASLRAQHGEGTAVNPLFDSLKATLHGMVDLLPWRQESDKQAAHAAVETHAPEPQPEPNPVATVPAGVVEQATPAQNLNPATADSFPSNPQE